MFSTTETKKLEQQNLMKQNTETTYLLQNTSMYRTQSTMDE